MRKYVDGVSVEQLVRALDQLGKMAGERYRVRWWENLLIWETVAIGILGGAFFATLFHLIQGGR